MKKAVKGRFAPSPTGHMHIGNAWVAFLSFLSARAQCGQYVLRIEDIDLERSKKEYAKAIIDDLLWLGVTWDEGPETEGSGETYYQSNRSEIYEYVLQSWNEARIIYPCFCNRARLRSIASAPHEGEYRYPYDGLCFGISEWEYMERKKGRKPSYRVHMEDSEGFFEDGIQGIQTYHIKSLADDIVVKRGDGMYAYQFAVSVDDSLMGITEILRGHDLLDSTPIQIAFHKRLSSKLPKFFHVPLLVDSEGYRLSKRQKSITIREMKQEGVSRERLISIFAKLAGLCKKDNGYRYLRIEEALELAGEKAIKGESIFPNLLKRTHITWDSHILD